MQDITLSRTNTEAFAYNTTSPVEFLGKFEEVPKKTGQVRICVDMRLANEAIRRVRHPIP